MSRINSNVLRFPEPTGAGSPRSLESGFLTQLMVCRGVKPERMSLGSAPTLMSSMASSKWPFRIASNKGLNPWLIGCSLALLPARIVLSRCRVNKAFTSTPASIRFSATSMLPSRTANKSGVNPEPRVC